MVVGVWVCPILENSTACTMSMPNTSAFFFGTFEIPLVRWIVSIDSLICHDKLVHVMPIPVDRGH